MAEIKFANNATSILNGALTNVATTINVAPGEGSKFPALAAGDWCYATIEESSPAVPAFPVREIVKVTARSSDALTVTRGQDGTTARAWLSGDKIELRWTAATVADLRAEIAALDSALAALKVSKAGDTMTGNLNVPSLNGGPLAGFRNKAINGAFDVAQRGNGGFTTAAKCADMWNASWDGTGGTRSISRWTHAAGAEIEGQFQYLRWTQSAAGTATWNTLENLVEYVRTLNGKQVTLSFWAKADAARTIAFWVRQAFGSGGSTQVDTTQQNFSLTTAWQKFTHTFTMPSVSGKTIGSDSKLALIFALPLTAFTIEITNVQLEEGPVATPFESRPYSVELALCQRYFYRLNSNSSTRNQRIGMGLQSSSTYSYLLLSLPQAMRVGAGTALTLDVPAAGNIALYNGSNSGYGTSISLSNEDNGDTWVPRTVTLQIGHNAWGAAGQVVFGTVIANYLAIGAEL